MNIVSWTQCDSRNDMLARLSMVDSQVFDELITEDANTWGYLTLNKKKCIPIGFANVGLSPEIFLHNKMLYVGITDTVAGFDVSRGQLIFSYKAPTVFHKFINIDEENVIFQDEMGFIGLTHNGNEKWVKLCSDIIDTCYFSKNTIYGETLDGEKFKFSIT